MAVQFATHGEEWNWIAAHSHGEKRGSWPSDQGWRDRERRLTGMARRKLISQKDHLLHLEI
jgi:hypothetical protein